MKYYGLDWLIYFLISCHLLLVRRHFKMSCVLGGTASALAAIFCYWIESYCGVAANLVFLSLHVKNFSKS